ncbi:hypothetical protein FGG08_006273 [Glutinoglossum americanum]|uniref:ferric-chelate reductase (NADPH) n=1 Tax=Glutinoglossum americanum TaxID=1670608 RepID=A0A9P8L123_9PEZI|nr:hypothetical protein FGG08_006273 [Glutinoglossum americanum]
MPTLRALAARANSAARELDSLILMAEREVLSLAKRINIPVNSTSPQALVDAQNQDPWSKSGKYALGWVYFCLVIATIAAIMHLYFYWIDKIRTALFKEAMEVEASTSPQSDYEMASLATNSTAAKLFPRDNTSPEKPKAQSSISSIGPLNNVLAGIRWLFYRPIPRLRWRKHEITFPSLGVTMIVFSALAFVTLYSFLPQPLYRASIAYGSPPLAIRAGMIAVAMTPWIVALSMKANLVSAITGIGHERLNILHRWGGYICLFLSLVHTIPFYLHPVWDQGGWVIFQRYFPSKGPIYTTGIASLVPLLWLCIASLPILRRWMYELFVALHVPVAIVYLAMLFWHCHNFLTSWHYLFATLGIWILSYCARLFKLNWTNPWRMSWLIGDEAAVTILPENALKITIPTQVKWRPGQYVYLRMPGISIFENHPFTVTSLCSEDFPSEYGEGYRDMILVFRPFGGFTKKVLNAAIAKGPYKTYRAFLDGPYGGMKRQMDSFDTVVLVAGGSGVTALVSQLIDLVKRMRDGKAITKTVHVLWAIKRLEAVDWFREELRICREYAPPDSVRCHFFVTAAKRHGASISISRKDNVISDILHDKLNNFAQGIASKRNSALIRDEAAGDPERERELRRENEDRITALPKQEEIKAPEPAHTRDASQVHSRQRPSLTLSMKGVGEPNFEFGFPETPTMIEKSLVRFAFGVSAVGKKQGWLTEYGRPDLPYMLRDLSKEFGKRTCVYVCGPPGMREDVANTVARMQREVWRDPYKDEIFLHTENYAL